MHQELSDIESHLIATVTQPSFDCHDLSIGCIRVGPVSNAGINKSPMGTQTSNDVARSVCRVVVDHHPMIKEIPVVLQPEGKHEFFIPKVTKDNLPYEVSSVTSGTYLMK